MHSAARRSLAAAILVLAACADSPVEPQAVDAPAFAVTGQENSPTDVVYRYTTSFSVFRRFVVPCLVDEPGEVVIFRLEGTGHFQRFRDATGTMHHDVQWHVQSATAEGFTSGETYQVSGGGVDTQRETEDGVYRYFATRFRIVHPGTGDVFFDNSVLRFAPNADGEYAYDGVVESTVECR